jgi:hypothetical protein
MGIIDVQWAIAAQARQYEESLKITRQLENGTLSEEDYFKKWQKPVNSGIIIKESPEKDQVVQEVI